MAAPSIHSFETDSQVQAVFYISQLSVDAIMNTYSAPRRIVAKRVIELYAELELLLVPSRSPGASGVGSISTAGQPAVGVAHGSGSGMVSGFENVSLKAISESGF